MNYRCEAIHPFVDGNGRTGRVLNLLYLVDKWLLDIPVHFLSRHVIRTKAIYYRDPLEVTTKQEWETWILLIFEAVRSTAEWTTAKIHAVRELLAKTAAAIRQGMPKIYSRELAGTLPTGKTVSAMRDWGFGRNQAVTLMQASRSGSIPSSSNALSCSSVGSEASRNRLSGRPGREAWFSVSVPRSASSVVRLWTGSPSRVLLSAALAFARSETLAGSTGELRCARAPSRSSSSNRSGARSRRMCHSTWYARGIIKIT